ncbi:RING-H2 finger protein ATL5-like [Curcuma longa]|uniref:RING-H2 finger protein ATL5-like n=1 Tax=Curcuma longa TaxID=136217 RepID=UPI003D9ED01A
MSQAGPSGSAPTTSPPSWLSPVGHGRLLYFLFTVLNVGLILLVYYYLWRLFFSRSDRLNEPATVATAPSSPSAGSPSASTLIAGSLHSETLSALPVFDYASTAAGDEKLECAVCLSEFRDGDKGRLLPRCGHRFHVDCVDTWFQSHSTCPICRSTVEPKASGSDEAV